MNVDGVTATVIEELCSRKLKGQVWCYTDGEGTEHKRKEMPESVRRAFKTALSAQDESGDKNAKWADAFLLSEREKVRDVKAKIKQEIASLEDELAAARATCAAGPEDLTALEAVLQAARDAIIETRRSSQVLRETKGALEEYAAGQDKQVAKLNHKAANLRLETSDMNRTADRTQERADAEGVKAAAKLKVLTDKIEAVNEKLAAAKANVDKSSLIHDALGKQRIARELEIHAARNCPAAIVELRRRVEVLEGRLAEEQQSGEKVSKKLAVAHEAAQRAEVAEEQKSGVFAEINELTIEVRTLERFRNAKRNLVKQRITEMRELETQIAEESAQVADRKAAYDAFVFRGTHPDGARQARSFSTSPFPEISTSPPARGNRQNEQNRGRRLFRSPSLPILRRRHSEN